MSSLRITRRGLIVCGAASLITQPALAEVSRKKLPSSLTPTTWLQEPIAQPKQKSTAQATVQEKPAAPAVSDSKRVSRQGVRYLDVISRYDGKRHRVPYFVNGQYIDDASSDINRALCDWRNGEMYDIKRGLLDFQWKLRQKLETDEPFFVLSGYRSPRTNAMLRKKSKNVARNSLHLKGQASDLRLKSRSSSQVTRAARACRKGGVGKYSENNFTHIDCGAVRTWGA